MKKPKMNFDAAKIQDFLFHHIEKLLLVVVVGLMGFLIWQGMKLQGLEGDLKPVGLKQKAEEMRAFIDEGNRWTEVAAARTPTMDILQKVEASQLQINAGQFPFPISLNRPNFPKHNPRSDPKLFPPENVVVWAGTIPLACYAAPKELDPLSLIPAEVEPAKIKRVQKSAKPKTPPPGGEAYTPPGEGVTGPGGKIKKGRTKRGEAPLGEGGPGQTPAPGFGEGGVLQPGDLYHESIADGFLPQNPEATVARHVNMMLVTAVVPVQRQFDEFEKALAQSLDFDAQRDLPWYLNFELQRADVTANPAGPINWDDPALVVTIDPRAVFNKQFGSANRPDLIPEFAGAPVEVVDLNYLDPVAGGGRLTHPAPPVLHRDLWPLLTHPDIPLATALVTGGEGAVGGGATGAAGGEDTGDLFGPGPTGQGGAPGGFGGEGRPGGMGGGFGRGSGDGGYTRPMMGGGPAMGGYRPSGGEYASGQMVTPPKYKLIRMTDTDKAIQPGRKYSYRVRVWLHDPNNPALPAIPPSLASLDNNVQKRISEVKAEVKAGKRKPQYASVLMTDWSQPSAPVSLPSTDRFLAVSAAPPKAPLALPQRPLVWADQPKADALVVAFDKSKVCDVPVETSVYRGTWLNMTQDVKVIHPVTKTLIDVEKHPVRTYGLVADLLGGEPIPTLDKGSPNTVWAPAEMVVLDASGRLRVQNEVDDIENIRRFGIPKAPPPVSPDGGAAPGPGGFNPLGPGSSDGRPSPRRPKGG